MTDMHTSRIAPTTLRCGHAMHSNCYVGYAKTNIACPICRKSMCDPKLFEAQMDNEIACMPMPAEYANQTMVVACNDCGFKSKVKFHIAGGKCLKCRSYNTQRVETKEDEIPEDLKQKLL